jgi:hypothetical protein
VAAASPIQLLALGFDAVGGFETDAQRAAFENMPPLGTTGRRGGDSLRVEQRKLQSLDSILAASLCNQRAKPRAGGTIADARCRRCVRWP